MNIIIIGCGRFGGTLARKLSATGDNISVIDSDGERLKTLGSGFNGLIVRGIEYDDEVLKEAGIDTADVFIAMTSDENINITACLIAKERYKINKIIARIVNPGRQYIYDKLKIETINPIQLGVDILTSKISAKNEAEITPLDSVYELARINVSKDKQFTVNELENKFGCIISGIIQNGDFVIPLKQDKIEKGETIVCTIAKCNLEKILSLLTREIYI